MTNDPGTLRDNVRRQYAAMARQDKATNASSCCGAGGCSTEVYNIMTDDYTGLADTLDADLGLGCGLPTQFAGIRPVTPFWTWAAVRQRLLRGAA